MAGVVVSPQGFSVGSLGLAVLAVTPRGSGSPSCSIALLMHGNSRELYLNDGVALPNDPTGQQWNNGLILPAAQVVASTTRYAYRPSQPHFCCVQRLQGRRQADYAARRGLQFPVQARVGAHTVRPPAAGQLVWCCLELTERESGFAEFVRSSSSKVETATNGATAPLKWLQLTTNEWND